jgi:hypothetical protein
MDIVNGWKSKNKQWDKLAVKVRIGKLTLFDLHYDHSRRQVGIIILNLGLRTASPQKAKDNDHIE